MFIVTYGREHDYQELLHAVRVLVPGLEKVASLVVKGEVEHDEVCHCGHFWYQHSEHLGGPCDICNCQTLGVVRNTRNL